MTNEQYALNSALPFDVSEHDADAQKLLNAAPASIWQRINAAEDHEEEVTAYDALTAWMGNNWRAFFPEFAR